MNVDLSVLKFAEAHRSGAEDKLKITHKCGCVTEDFNGGIKITPCELHKNNYIYIALQHKRRRRLRKVKN